MYGTMMTLAFTLAFLHVHTRAHSIGVHRDRLVPIYIAAAVGGLVGSRVLYVIAVEGLMGFLNPAVMFSGGGFAIYGGLIGGALGVFTLGHFQGFDGWKLADLLAPALLLGMGIGRVGCFFAGCCHGAEAPFSPEIAHLIDEGPWFHGEVWLDVSTFPFVTTEFHDGVGRLLHRPLYPTQAWAATALVSLWGLLTLVWMRRKFDGQVVAIMLMIEPVTRIFIESFRADHRGYTVSWAISPELAQRLPPGITRAGDQLNTAVMGFTTSQTLGFFMIVLGVVIYVLQRNKGVAPETPIHSDDDDD